MTRHNLAIEYSMKDKIKEKHPIKFDFEQKLWFYEGDLPEDLMKYRQMSVDIKYDDRDEYKAKFKSLFWDRSEKSWKCSTEDFEKIEIYRQ